MSTYYIPEVLIEKLETRVAAIQRKCNQLGCEFSYERRGEEYLTVHDDEGKCHTLKHIEVYVDGVARINGWRFVATLEHTDAGNIIRQYDHNIEVPTNYRTADIICEHCNTTRNRRDTYLIHNDETGEWKQVGRSCLKVFTNGLDADAAAWLISVTDVFDNYTREVSSSMLGASHEYYPVMDILCYGYECVKHFGYVKSDERDNEPTGYKALSLYNYIERGRSLSAGDEKKMDAEIQRTHFNALSDENRQYVSAAVEWARSQDATDSCYLHNLQIAISSDYVAFRNVRIAVSLIAAYRRHLKDIEAKQVAREEHEKSVATSKHIGQVKSRVHVDVASAELVTGWYTAYGWSGMFRFMDTAGNVFIWITSSVLDLDKEVASISGTVKEHSEYRDVKQTVLTRCKIEYKN